MVPCNNLRNYNARATSMRWPLIRTDFSGLQQQAVMTAPNIILQSADPRMCVLRGEFGIESGPSCRVRNRHRVGFG